MKEKVLKLSESRQKKEPKIEIQEHIGEQSEETRRRYSNMSNKTEEIYKFLENIRDAEIIPVKFSDIKFHAFGDSLELYIEAGDGKILLEENGEKKILRVSNRARQHLCTGVFNYKEFDKFGRNKIEMEVEIPDMNAKIPITCQMAQAYIDLISKESHTRQANFINVKQTETGNMLVMGLPGMNNPVIDYDHLEIVYGVENILEEALGHPPEVKEAQLWQNGTYSFDYLVGEEKQLEHVGDSVTFFRYRNNAVGFGGGSGSIGELTLICLNGAMHFNARGSFSFTHRSLKEAHKILVPMTTSDGDYISEFERELPRPIAINEYRRNKKTGINELYLDTIKVGTARALHYAEDLDVRLRDAESKIVRNYQNSLKVFERRRRLNYEQRLAVEKIIENTLRKTKQEPNEFTVLQLSNAISQFANFSGGEKRSELQNLAGEVIMIPV